ncbi:MauE/DoxX family redox-associated membrane protein [Ornithinimicrobium sp. W1679]|uniref:MauE/DoxX family redox-associated membrane protein n=1 Tax=Ornithinimicrobium sp. W1679 TaxID=3418770 RepID=UPI003CE6FF10
MHPALSLAPLTLAAVLVLSGVAKLQDAGSTFSVLRLLRLPALVTNRPTARALPVVELVTAALLLLPWRWPFLAGAVLAMGLFVAFWAVVVRAMGFDPRPTCGCFGRIGDHRINGRTVVRNTVLVALAGLTLWIGLAGTSTGELLARYTANDMWWLVLAVALAAVSVMVLGGGPAVARTTRRTGRGGAARSSSAPAPAAAATTSVPAEPDELEYVRLPIPRGVLVGRDHGTVALSSLARSQAQLLVLVNCWCGPTHEALERLPRWRERLPQLGVQMVFVPHPFDASALDPGLSGIWWDPGSRVYDDLGVGSSPGAVLLGADGLLAGGPVNGVDGIEQFVEDIEAELAETQDATSETSAPPPGEQQGVRA